MDIKTCEQYVLAELEETKRKNEELEARNEVLEYSLNMWRTMVVQADEKLNLLKSRFVVKPVKDTDKEFICFESIWNDDPNYAMFKQILSTEEKNND